MDAKIGKNTCTRSSFKCWNRRSFQVSFAPPPLDPRPSVVIPDSSVVKKQNENPDVVEGAGRKAKQMVLQCINGVGSNPVEGRTKIWQL